MISFDPPLGTPIAFLAAGCITLVCIFWSLRRLEKGRLARLVAFADHDALARLVRGYHPALRRPLNALICIGALLLMLALAGPQWGAKDGGKGRAAREILVLLDTSESMNALDPLPNRLDRARRKVTELLVRHPADRFGLIAFSGGASLQCPLTSDRAYFKTILHAVNTDTLSEEGTDFESAFQSAEVLFRGSDAREEAVGRAGRVVLLISDGEEVTGDAMVAAGRLRAISHVMVLGIGSPEGVEITMPTWMAHGTSTQRGSNTHWSRLDEEKLADIALEGGGVYVRSTLGDEDLNVIDRELAFLRGGLGDDTVGQRRVNRYRWPLSLAALCFLLEGVWLVILPRFAGMSDDPVVEEGAL